MSAFDTAKTHCPSGHPYSDENTIHGSRGRRCRACRRAENLRYRTSHAEAIRDKAKRRGVERPAQEHGRVAVWVATRAGRLVKQPCAVCGAAKVQAHHHNGYSEAHILDVVWLCPYHHGQAHVAMRAASQPPSTPREP